MGIPPEIARAEGTGAYAGRFVPQQAFYSTLQSMLQWLIGDADEQIFRRLVIHNFGDDEYEIIPFPLIDSLEENNVEQNAPGMDANGQPDQSMQMSQEDMQQFKIYLEHKKRRLEIEHKYADAICNAGNMLLKAA